MLWPLVYSPNVFDNNVFASMPVFNLIFQKCSQFCENPFRHFSISEISLRNNNTYVINITIIIISVYYAEITELCLKHLKKL